MAVFPIGIGPNYDSVELKVLGEHGHQDNSLRLSSRDQLRMVLTLDHSFIDRMCRGIKLKHTHTHFVSEAQFTGRKSRNVFALQLGRPEFVLTTTELRGR